MKLYGGIDLHSNNSVIGLLDEEDQMIYQRRLRNDLPTILEILEPYREKILEFMESDSLIYGTGSSGTLVSRLIGDIKAKCQVLHRSIK